MPLVETGFKQLQATISAIVARHDNCPKSCAQLWRCFEQQRSVACRASVCWGVSADRRRFDRLRSVARRAVLC